MGHPAQGALPSLPIATAAAAHTPEQHQHYRSAHMQTLVLVDKAIHEQKIRKSRLDHW
jgi:hypothetical protein